MTAFTTAQLPTGDATIVTVEALKLWCDLIIKANAGDIDMIRVESEKSTSVCRVHFYVDRDKIERCECTSQLRLAAGWETAGNNPWTQVVPFNNVPIPSRFSGDGGSANV